MHFGCFVPQVRTCSVAVPRTSRNSGSKNREPTRDRSIGDPCPEAVFSIYQSSNLNDPEQEETQHSKRDLPIHHVHINCFIIRCQTTHLFTTSDLCSRITLHAV